ncbi:hypothetical protein OsI_14914 [Oryza sativa Indica Group]|uniref:Uncharacterized protein n=1 Tax=Oryza sativa subsp. indica TaxID=39946 RepID=B8AVD4_ORYSI|nr:hypothetical protein OsI_14914 [Oryza sativa Indica Group]
MSDVNKVEVEAEALPHIEGLHIVKKVSEGIEFLRSLKKLWLLNLHKDFNTYSKRNGMHEKMVCGQEVESHLVEVHGVCVLVWFIEARDMDEGPMMNVVFDTGDGDLVVLAFNAVGD